MASQAESIALVDQHPPTPPTSKPKIHRGTWLQLLMSDSWTLEWLAMATSITALASIAITLSLYNGKPLLQWSHTISLNTVISTLGTAMKSFLMVAVGSCLSQLKWLWYTHRKSQKLLDFQIFDNASRGPWGAALLLLRLRFWHLASIGSFVTLLALVSDPFVQQSVSYPLINSPSRDKAATVPYSSAFNQYINGKLGVSGPILNEPMQASIYNGIFSPNLSASSSAIKASCSSGNCTFQPYDSLAVCSKCANVTAMLHYEFSPGNLSIPSFYNWTLPNGHTLGNYEFFDEANTITFINISTSGSVALTILPLNSDTLSAYQSDGTITNVSIITSTGNGDHADDAIAWDCMLYFCARSYSSAVSLGLYTENMTHEYDRPVWTSNQTDANEITYTFALPDAVNKSSVKFTSFALGTLVASLVQLSGFVRSAAVDATSDIAQGFFYNDITEDAPARVVDNIALALTNAMRQVSQQTIPGTIWALEAHIKVEWLWLILPLVTVLLAVVFLAATVWQNGRSDVPSWRSSALAVMEHGVNSMMLDSDGETENGSSTAIGAGLGKEGRGELEDWAKDVDVRLRRRGGAATGYGLTVT